MALHLGVSPYSDIMQPLLQRRYLHNSQIWRRLQSFIMKSFQITLNRTMSSDRMTVTCLHCTVLMKNICTFSEKFLVPLVKLKVRYFSQREIPFKKVGCRYLHNLTHLRFG